MLKEVVIIGSGPSALATMRILEKSHLELKITVLDIDSSTRVSNPMGLKSYFGSTDIYDQEGSQIRHSNIRAVVWPSSGRGGFSRIWGAVIDEKNLHNFGSYINFGLGENNSPFATKSAFKIREKYQSVINPRWELLEHHVAVDPKLCIQCGNCLTGCPTNAIWFAGDEWLKFTGIDYISDFRVQEIKLLGDKVLITANSGAKITTDWVFVAAGAISSVQILMRSELIPKIVTMRDTNAVFFPAFRFPVWEKRESFSLSQLSAILRDNNSVTGYIQFYPDSRKLSEPIARHLAFLGRVISRIWFALSPFFMSGIIYLNKDYSQGFTLSMIAKDSFEISKKKERNLSKSFLKKNAISRSLFFDFGIIPLFFLGKKGEPGESYHFGAVAEVLSFNNQSDLLPIRVVDSSALATLEPGPITDKIMENAALITSKFLEKMYEVSN